MLEFLHNFMLVTYLVPVAILLAFGLNLYLMIFYFSRRRREYAREMAAITRDFREQFNEASLPEVVTQIAVFNEFNVAERCMRAVAAIDYPKHLHVIQVLDDSTDNTCRLVDRVSEELSAQGYRMQIIRRKQRIGFKAGALENGMRLHPAPFYAIFDADFVPPADFIRRALPVLLSRPEIGLVQGRWGHLNREASLLTRAQAIGIDGHFTIEQPARAWNNLFMNFNGTAGMWRREAIEDAGGWEHDTLTEDMDLSYRSQLAGWKPFFMWDLMVQAEIPEDINAFKSQQFRWAKGSIETATKLLPRVFRSDRHFTVKLQAVFHMTHYLVHPIMVWLAMMSYPVMKWTVLGDHPVILSITLAFIVLGSIAPSAMYTASQLTLYNDGFKRLLLLPLLSLLGVGIALSNTRAVLEALAGRKSAFIRTPKKGDANQVLYRIKMPYLAILELTLGAYCLYTLTQYMSSARMYVLPFVLLYTCGFIAVGVLSLIQNLHRPKLRPQAA